jgi:transcriptional regulator GlxA family with amidase domain
MPRSTSAGVSFAGVSEAPFNCLDVVGLSKLIEAASASLDADRETAKAYMQRAAELLRGFREVRGTAHRAFSCTRSGLATWQQKRVVAYVEANIGTNIRATDLARVVRMSKGHFFRAFRESFGEPPMAYVVKRRVVLGQELMRKSRAPLSEIALACGMCDQPHFTRLFHRIVGVSPGLWRRQFASGRGVLATTRTDGVAGYDSVN